MKIALVGDVHVIVETIIESSNKEKVFEPKHSELSLGPAN